MKKTPRVDLQNKKILFFEIGLAIALLFTLLAFNWATSESSVKGNLADYSQLTAEVEEDLPITVQEPPAPQEIQVQQVLDVIEIVDNTVDLPSNFQFNAEFKEKEAIKLADYVNNNKPKQPTETTVDEAIPAPLMKDPPKFQGGDANNFTRWVMSNIQYPSAAQDNGIQGTVFLSFEIGTDGRLDKLKLTRGVDPLLDQEAMRVVAMSPLWTPGRQHGKLVRVSYQFPVKFKLQ